MGSIAERPSPAQAATVTTHTVKLAQDIRDQAQDLAMFVYRAAQRAGLISASTTFSPVDERTALTSEQRGELRAASTVAIRLIDPCARGMANEQGALAILRHITRGVEAGSIAADSPLTRLDLSHARQLSQLALERGLNYLGGKDVE